MARICIIGDAHLLYQAEWVEDEGILRNEAKEVLDEFELAVKNVISDTPDIIVFVGDMFDTRTESGQRVVHREAEKYMPKIRNILNRLTKTDCKIYALRGNHDSEPVLKSLESVMGNAFAYVGNKTVSIDNLHLSFLNTHYTSGNYEVSPTEIPKGDILFMHESISIGGILGLSKENLEKICNMFKFVFNGHMHIYKENVLGIPNLYTVPAFIPSRRIKNNWVLKFRYENGKIESEKQESPFGYLILDENNVKFRRYDPIQTVVLVEIAGKTVDDFISGVKSIYEMFMEREDKDKLRIWIKTNADKITIERVIWPQVLRYSDIKTLDIESERPEVLRAPIPSIEEEFGDVAFTRDELIDKLFPMLRGNEIDIARKLFDEIFTPQFLQSRNPNEVDAFKKLLELFAKDRKVSQAFVQRAWDLCKGV
ncbi:MAG: metallophosphoesterase [Nitrososphaerota archaeon]